MALPSDLFLNKYEDLALAYRITCKEGSVMAYSRPFNKYDLNGQFCVEE